LCAGGQYAANDGGEVVRLGPARSVVSTTPFSTKTHEEHSQQIDVRLHSLPAFA
jgi:hypothetical protein